jgi:hypothetical protein
MFKNPGNDQFSGLCVPYGNNSDLKVVIVVWNDCNNSKTGVIFWKQASRVPSLLCLGVYKCIPLESGIAFDEPEKAMISVFRFGTSRLLYVRHVHGEGLLLRTYVFLSCAALPHSLFLLQLFPEIMTQPLFW